MLCMTRCIWDLHCTQIATADAFASIARDRLLSPVDLQVCVLPMVTRSINKEKSEEVGGRLMDSSSTATHSQSTAPSACACKARTPTASCI